MVVFYAKALELFPQTDLSDLNDFLEEVQFFYSSF